MVLRVASRHCVVSEGMSALHPKVDIRPWSLDICRSLEVVFVLHYLHIGVEGEGSKYQRTALVRFGLAIYLSSALKNV